MPDKQDDFRVADVLTPMRLVLNCGSNDGIKLGDKFWVYAFGAMMKDPETGIDLERLVLPRGNGKVVYLQQKICTIESIDLKQNNLLGVSALMFVPEVQPFLSPSRGDRARRLGVFEPA